MTRSDPLETIIEESFEKIERPTGTITLPLFPVLSLLSLASHREHKAQFLLLSPALIKNLSGIDLWQLFVCFAETFAAARPGLRPPCCLWRCGPGLCLQNFNPKLNEILCPRVFLFVVLVAGCGVWPACLAEWAENDWCRVYITILLHV